MFNIFILACFHCHGCRLGTQYNFPTALTLWRLGLQMTPAALCPCDCSRDGLASLGDCCQRTRPRPSIIWLVWKWMKIKWRATIFFSVCMLLAKKKCTADWLQKQCASLVITFHCKHEIVAFLCIRSQHDRLLNLPLQLFCMNFSIESELTLVSNSEAIVWPVNGWSHVLNFFFFFAAAL